MLDPGRAERPATPAPELGGTLFSALRPEEITEVQRDGAALMEPARAQLEGLLDRAAIGPATPAEELLVQQWRSRLPEAAWGPLLINWARALEVCGSSSGLVDRVRYDKVCLPRLGVTLDWFNGNYEERRSLLEQSRAAFARSEEEYAAHQRFADSQGMAVRLKSCGLCRNALTAVETRRRGLPSNALLELEGYLLLPDLAPLNPGDMLFLPKRHDPEEGRSPPQPHPAGGEGKGGRRWPVVPGLNRERLPPPEELYALMSICDALDMAMRRHHTVWGKSVWCHDHYKLTPAPLPGAGAVARVSGVARPEAASARRAARSPFDSLVLISPDRAELALAAHRLLGRLEADHQIYVLNYHDRQLLCSAVRHGAALDENVDLGASLPVLGLGPHAADYESRVLRHMPRPGEFPWESYLR